MPTPANSSRDTPLAQRLAALGAELQRWRAFWSAHAFREPVLPWEAERPDLAAALRALDPEHARRLGADQTALDGFLGTWFPVERWAALERVDAAPRAKLRPWPRGFDRDVPGRKWAQIEAFSASVLCAERGTVVDWCAGKAHLGRALAFQRGAPGVLALERDARLTAAARSLARREDVSLRAETCDVLEEGVRSLVTEASQIVALHACGALHRRLLDVAVAERVPALAVAPCCFHLGPDGHLPRSRAAQDSDPALRPEDVRTAVQDEVTSGGHARRRREHLQSWQLGFDALLREYGGRAAYTAAPGASARMLAGDFGGYCRDVAAARGICLPEDIDAARWEARGQERFREVSALDLVRRRFRRLIELWLLTDLAVSLEEAGYDVRLECFCAPGLSPRNLLLQASLAA